MLGRDKNPQTIYDYNDFDNPQKTTYHQVGSSKNSRTKLRVKFIDNLN